MCEDWTHISDFYTAKLLGNGLDDVDDIWFSNGLGAEWGRPLGYCKLCTRAANKSKAARKQRILEAVQARQDKQRAEREALEAAEKLRAEIEAAHRLAIFEDRRWDMRANWAKEKAEKAKFKG
jgi:hypothetical protein